MAWKESTKAQIFSLEPWGKGSQACQQSWKKSTTQGEAMQWEVQTMKEEGIDGWVNGKSRDCFLSVDEA